MLVAIELLNSIPVANGLNLDPEDHHHYECISIILEYTAEKVWHFRFMVAKLLSSYSIAQYL